MSTSLTAGSVSRRPSPPATGDFAITKDEIKAGKKEYSPYLHQAYPDRVFLGDTHLHTSYSTDSGGLAGRTALTS